uniref:Uncharacterized protein n=1 Tax=Lepeophtheirus salmonis TaxID=72036 RepID=A0A0K2V633_LEPSM
MLFQFDDQHYFIDIFDGPYYQNGILGTTVLLFHSILYWVPKQYHFFGCLLRLFILVVLVILNNQSNFLFFYLYFGTL